MSDNTANAREPSMEDILASIRRIIDEEDTRDARPASDHVTPVEDRDHETLEGALPVMAAAPVSRDEDEDAGLFDEVDDPVPGDTDGPEHLDSDGGSVFPERESPFWSRATGRDAPDSPSDDGGRNGDDYVAAFNAESHRDEPSEMAVQEKLPGARPDIFTRAQNKLGGAPRLSTRERIQSLAARAEERAEATAKADIVAPDFGHLPDDTADEMTDQDQRDSQDHRASIDDGDDLHDTIGHDVDQSAIEDSDVLDLTNPVEPAEGSDETVFVHGDGAISHDDDRDDNDTSGQDSSNASEVPPVAPDSSSWNNDIDTTRDHSHDMDDVLDLTTPLTAVDAGSVENGETFHVSGVEEADADDGDIEEAISLNLVEDDVDRDRDETTSFDTPVDFHDTERAAEDDTPVKTYSRFDTVEERDETVSDETAEEVSDETFDTYSAAFVTLDDDVPSAPDVSETVALEAEKVVEASLPEEPEEDALSDESEEEILEPDENLGFPDTFGASDVYHDEPPALDEDYSRSLDDSDELAAEQAAFAAQLQEDDGMEAVGGMVRDAMERDPVDYADPAALVSMTSEEISARALASLADVEGEASRRVYGSLKISESSEGSDSLEGMVRGMLKPMLREWLDDNLPTMVESAVRGEVERISSKSRKYSRAADND